MDMLVKLYGLPDLHAAEQAVARHGVVVRRAMAAEKNAVVGAVGELFGDTAPGWASESEIAFARMPISCFLAVQSRKFAGFSCYDTTFKGFFGPVGVAPEFRNRGIGSALLTAALHALRTEGYAYAIIGHVGAPDFFRSAVGAIEIEGSTPGAYPGRRSNLDPELLPPRSRETP